MEFVFRTLPHDETVALQGKEKSKFIQSASCKYICLHEMTIRQVLHLCKFARKRENH